MSVLYHVLGPHNSFPIVGDVRPQQMYKTEFFPEGTVQTEPYTYEKGEDSHFCVAVSLSGHSRSCTGVLSFSLWLMDSVALRHDIASSVLN